MPFIEDIKILCVKRGKISQSELARRLGESPQNFYLRLKRNSIKDSDLKQIALALNCKAEIVYKDIETGKEILISNL